MLLLLVSGRVICTHPTLLSVTAMYIPDPQIPRIHRFGSFCWANLHRPATSRNTFLAPSFSTLPGDKTPFGWSVVHSVQEVHKVDMFERQVHPGRLTWNIIMEVWKILFFSKWVICRFHVNLPGCKAIKSRPRTCLQSAIFLHNDEETPFGMFFPSFCILSYCSCFRNPARKPPG